MPRSMWIILYQPSALIFHSKQKHLGIEGIEAGDSESEDTYNTEDEERGLRCTLKLKLP